MNGISLTKLKHRPDLSMAYADVERLQPGMSPNVFSLLRDIIDAKDRPVLIETGIGISTYHLCNQLRIRGGSYTGVEHDRGWFEIVEEGRRGSNPFGEWPH